MPPVTRMRYRQSLTWSLAGACRGLVFGGGITPDLITAPGVTSDLAAPPEILTAPPGPQNYRFFKS